ncbi:hypothetical protein GUJ93_ZPchr0002g23807 [Zizania palustris]|uniref:DUF7597 domain-containing protein n=1 Tax=Zizania palustris TaxID=103762 RepID=A0A8J5ST36_ZIZPA|nr:hypothetical protein GUJ93_ZPchr0002g23807 [Zizania palustris]
MANFPANSLPFLPLVVAIDDGGGPELRHRDNVCISSHVVASHEEFAIASCIGIIDEIELKAFLHSIHQHFVETL